MGRSVRILILTFSVVGALLPTPFSRAATIVVTRQDDPSPNGCRPRNCSLREAVIAANNQPGFDIIELKARTYNLTIAGTNENGSATGDLDIKRDTTIVGKGKSETTIDAHMIDRALHVTRASAEVAVRKLAIRKGRDDAGSAEGGGAIANLGRLSLRDVLLTNNRAPQCCGGGVFNTGRLTVTDSRFSNNRTGTSCCGGAIYSYGADVRAKIKNSDFSGNRTSCCGGAVYNANQSRATILNSRFEGNEGTSCCGGALYNQSARTTVRSSLFDNNTMDSCCGGAIYSQNSGKMNVRGSIVSNNDVGACCGGGLYNQNSGAEMNVRNTVVRANKSPERGGGIFTQNATLNVLGSKIVSNKVTTGCCGGGIAVADGDVFINNTLFRNNKHLGIDDGGGALFSEGDPGDVPTVVRNSTFVNNTSDTDGGAIFTHLDGGLDLFNSTLSGNESNAIGGGFYELDSGPITLLHVTITGNESAGPGGGIGTDGTGSFTLIGTVVSGNTQDCNAIMGGATGTNLDGDSSCFTGAGALHRNARLKSLANNGGPTPTHALRSSSQAVDAVPGAQCPPPSRDQRGVGRPKDGDGTGPTRCDLGAFERKPGD